MSESPEPFDEKAWHRRTGVDLFNHVWSLLENPGRTPAEDDEMLHAAHASRHHWAQIGAPVNLARGEWQISRVYSVLGRPEGARYHAQRSLEICQANGIGDFDLAFAYEALARAVSLGGSREEVQHYLGLARQAAEQIAEADDREILLKDLKTIPGDPASREDVK
jgi:hypothetical protein